jgi:hypothetical protein
MKIINKEDLIKNVSKNWNSQYAKSSDIDKILISKRLQEENPQTENEISNIIGNKSWTLNICNECNKDSDTTIILGQEPDYDSATSNICLDCINKALRLFNESQKK